MRRSLVGVIVLAAGCVCSTLQAREANLGADSDSFNRRWLRDLKSDDFRVREEACARMAEAGSEAIAPLKDAAGDMDRETAARCLGVLERLSQSSDPPTSRAAREALSSLETSSNPVVADLARSALVKSEKLPPPRYSIGGAMALNMRRPMPVGNGFRVTTRTGNADRTTIIEEPGKTTTILESADNIRMTIIETANGAEKTTEHTAKDLEDLRRKAPAAAQVYEKWRRPLNLDPQKQLDDFRTKVAKARELSREGMDLSRERTQLRLSRQENTPEYADLEKRIQENREAQLKALQP